MLRTSAFSARTKFSVTTATLSAAYVVHESKRDCAASNVLAAAIVSCAVDVLSKYLHDQVSVARACCTISTRTFLVSAGLLTSRKNAMRAPRTPSFVFIRI